MNSSDRVQWLGLSGIGYGVIAGPVFLIIFNGVEALQLSVTHLNPLQKGAPPPTACTS